MRKLPNIIITGTPGVGKSSHCEALAAKLPMLQHLQVNQVAEQRGCFDGKDEQLGSWIVDEERLAAAIAPELAAGGLLIDWHACDWVGEADVDLVVVVRAHTDVLFDRLVGRGYAPAKIEENMDAEIFQELLEEAKAAFAEEMVVEMYSDTVEEMDANVERIVQWVDTWRKDQQKDD